METTCFSIKASLLDSQVLRSHSIDGIDQEVWALLTTYQALIRAASDAVTHRPGLDMDRLSFTILLQTAADTVITGHGITTNIDLVGTIGAAALAGLWPARRRHRVKARSIKNPTSKYGPNAGKHPQSARHYTVHTEVTYIENGLTSRSRRPSLDRLHRRSQA
ncbi:hypothetical protein ABZ667_42705 [Streptomyces lavendulae]|uniref:hypothetical protein n=1 Tax=Streptomyces lavendulae TaxID=1914 RepID=UPI0033F1B248